MTNGEKLDHVFPDGICPFSKNWLDYEYKEPTTKNDLGVDCISRASARSLISDIDLKYHTLGMTRKAFKDLYNGMDELPPVTPQEPKTGHWKRDRSNVRCSNCGRGYKDAVGRTSAITYNFCPNCGAKMVETQESEGKE